MPITNPHAYSNENCNRINTVHHTLLPQVPHTKMFQLSFNYIYSVHLYHVKFQIHSSSITKYCSTSIFHTQDSTFIREFAYISLCRNKTKNGNCVSHHVRNNPVTSLPCSFLCSNCGHKGRAVCLLPTSSLSKGTTTLSLVSLKSITSDVAWKPIFDDTMRYSHMANPEYTGNTQETTTQNSHRKYLFWAILAT